MREYAPDQTVFMFTISAAERQGHRGGQAGVFPDGLVVLPGCALSGRWCAARCACQGDSHQRLIRVRNINSRAGCACQGDAPQREQPQMPRWSGAVRLRGLGQSFTTGWCVPASPVVAGRPRVRRLDVHLFRAGVSGGAGCAAVSGADRYPACRWRARRRCWAPWHRWGCAGWRTGSARSGCPWRV